MLKRIALAAATLALATPAHADVAEFVLVNKTGKTLKLVELADTGSGNWVKETRDEDRGPIKIKPNDRYTVHFDKGAKACKFDVRLTFDDDSQAVWPPLDVCEFPFGELSYKGEAPATKGTY